MKQNEILLLQAQRNFGELCENQPTSAEATKLPVFPSYILLVPHTS
jgi:hypothetical protein